jgi:hypothetical protein
LGVGEGRALFTGDHIMGWSTTVVAPPDGNMASTSVVAASPTAPTACWPRTARLVTTPSNTPALVEHRSPQAAF